MEYEIELAYAEPGRSICRCYRLAPPVSIEQLRLLAAADPAFAGVDVVQASVGIFGVIAAPGQQLQDGDRVEIYRPLAADPKTARRARASAARRKNQ